MTVTLDAPTDIAPFKGFVIAAYDSKAQPFGQFLIDGGIQAKNVGEDELRIQDIKRQIEHEIYITLSASKIFFYAIFTVIMTYLFSNYTQHFLWFVSLSL